MHSIGHRIARMVYSVIGCIAPRMWSGVLYRRAIGRRLDWKNPQTLNEKINWLKFYGDTSRWSELADKYRVREYVRERGYGDTLVPLLGVWQRAEDIDFDALPGEFVLKTNNGSGDAVIVRDKGEIDPRDVRRRMRRALRRRFGRVEGEPHYLKIKPLIVAEALIKEPGRERPVDYKFFCFDGKPYCCMVIANRTKTTMEMATYDMQWREVRDVHLFGNRYHPMTQRLPRPEGWERMKEIAAALSQGFPQVRVDLYNIEGRIYFGELTFTTSAGHMSYYTDAYQHELGAQCRLPGQTLK